MPTFEITAPDGTVYEVDGPEGATEADALAQVRASLSKPPIAPKPAAVKGSAAKGAGMIASTLTEGAYRGLVEGPGQGVSTIAQLPFDLYDTARVGAPFMQAKPSASILSNYNEAVKTTRADRADKYQEQYGTSQDEAGIALGELLSGLALGGGPKSGASEGTLKILETMGRSIKSGAKSGAVGALTSFHEGADTSADQLMWTAGGGLLGAGIGLVPAAGAGLQTAFRKYLLNHPVGDAVSSARELEGFIPGLKGKLNAAQETGNAGVQKFLNRSAGQYAQEQLLEQTKTLQRHLENLDALYGKILPAEEAVGKGQDALVKVRTHMVEARKRIWNADLQNMRAKVTADVFQDTGVKSTSQVAVAMPGLEDGFNAITEDFVRRGGGALTPGFQRILDEYRAFNGHLSFDSLEYLLRLSSGNSGSIISGMSNPEAQRAAGKQLKNVVFSAIDKMDDQSEIGSMLKQMRAGYAKRSAAIKEFNETAAAKILNVKSGDLISDPEKAVDNLLNLDSGQLSKLTPVLKNLAPDTLSSLRSANIRKAYQEALIPNAKPGTPGWDLDTFLKATVKADKLRAAGLYSEGEQEVLTRNMVALRSLLQKTSQGADTPSTQSAVMAGISMAPAFVARTLFQLTGQGSIDKLLFNPESFAKFKQVNTLMQSEKWDQAAYLLQKMGAEASTPTQGDDE